MLLIGRHSCEDRTFDQHLRKWLSPYLQVYRSTVTYTLQSFERSIVDDPAKSISAHGKGPIRFAIAECALVVAIVGIR